MDNNDIIYIDNNYKIKEGTIVLCNYIDDKIVKVADEDSNRLDIFPMVETENEFIDPYMFAWVYKNNVKDADNKIAETNKFIKEVLLTLLSISLYQAYFDTKRLLENKSVLIEYIYDLVPTDFVIDILMDKQFALENIAEVKEEIIKNPNFVLLTEWPFDETIL